VKRIIIFDSTIDGHHSDYLSHPIRYWKKKEAAENQLIVVTSASFRPVFDELTSGTDNIIFDPIPDDILNSLLNASALKRSFAEWDCVINFMVKHQATHTLLMYFDLFQLGIALGKKAPAPVSGIYFRPDFHYKHAGFQARLTSFRKKFFLQHVLRRKEFRNLFCLDQSAVPYIKKFKTQAEIIPLPDPVAVHPQTPDQVRQLGQHLGVEPFRQVFLMFGHLDERKGIEPLLEAIKQLVPEQQEKVCLIFAGRPVNSTYKQQLENLISDMPEQVQIIPVFTKIPEEQIQTFFDLSDYVLVLYQNHIGMASVVIRAAISKKPVLASDYGYLREVVLREKLGAVTDTTSPLAIADLINVALETGIPYSVDQQEIFASNNSVEAFTEVLFERL
jgi:glycosyltransferase involved in cell wall biosynthesis